MKCEDCKRYEERDTQYSEKIPAFWKITEVFWCKEVGQCRVADFERKCSFYDERKTK